MFPLYIQAECMQMLGGGEGRGERSGSPFSRTAGGALRIPRQCVVISGHSCQTAPLVGPFSPRARAHTHSRAPAPSFCSPTQSKFVYCNFW